MPEVTTTHVYVGEDSGHCFYAFQEGVGANNRPKFEYCGEPKDAPCHAPSAHEVAARAVYEFRNDLRVEPLLPEIAEALSRMAPRDVEGFITVARALEPLLDSVSIFAPKPDGPSTGN